MPHLSCQGEAASFLGGAFPSELLDQEAFPLEDPLEGAYQGVGPSYLWSATLAFEYIRFLKQ